MKIYFLYKGYSLIKFCSKIFKNKFLQIKDQILEAFIWEILLLWKQTKIKKIISFFKFSALIFLL